MIAELVVAATVVLGGRTEEARPLRIEVSAGGRVTRVKGSVVDYECQQFGDVGPVRFDARVRARVDRRGRFSFVHGDRVQRIGVAGYLHDDGTARGRVRMTGTIATGRRCESDVVRFRVVRR